MYRLSFLLLLSLLWGCGTDTTTETPSPVSTPQTCVFTQSASTGTDLPEREVKLIMDATTSRVMRRETWESGKLIRYGLFEYNGQGLVEKETLHKPDGSLTGYYSYYYNENDNLKAWKSFNNTFDALRPGLQATYQYVSPTQLQSMTQHQGDGTLPTTSTYAYKDGLMHKVTILDKDGSPEQVTELEYDRQIHSLAAQPAMQKVNWTSHAFPYQHNITKETIYIKGMVIKEISYSCTYEYNTTGYPTKRTGTYLDGRTFTTVYSYECK